MSANQWGLLFLDNVLPESPLYHVMWTCPITGPLDVDLLGHALRCVAARHEALRTRFDLSDLGSGGGGWQIVEDEVRLDFAVVAPTDGDDPRGLAELVGTPPFDLAAGPLFRVRVVRRSAVEHRLVFNAHHLVFDGWSVGVFLTDLSRAYADLSGGGSGELEPPALGYGAYVERQAEAMPDLVSRQLPYWRTRLAELPAVAALPLDRSRPPVQSFLGAEVERGLPGLRAPLETLARQERVTLFTLLLAVFKAQLATYSADGDIVVGCPIGARVNRATRELIGYLINMTVLRTRVPRDATVRELLGSVRNTVFDALANQDVPFDTVVSELRPARGLSHNPLFQVLFSFDEDLAEPVSLGAARVGEVSGMPTNAAKFDLTFTVRDTGHELELNLEYATDLFDRRTVEALAHDYERLLGAVLADPDVEVRALPVTVPPTEHAGAPTPEPAGAVVSPAPYVPPGSAGERRLVAIWAEVLDVTGLGVRDDFFQVGGDSLSATRVAARVSAEFGVEISVRAMFDTPTVAGLAAHVAELVATPHRATTSRAVPRPRRTLGEVRAADTRAEINP